MPTVPTTEPLAARAGLTWQWLRSSSDYPAPTWSVTYYFKQLASAGAYFSVAATASGSDHLVDIAAATTAGYTAGDYSWSAVATDGSDTFELATGFLTVLPRYDQAAALDDRSHNRRMLDAIEAVLENRATSDMLEYTIGNRSLRTMARKDLEASRDRYAARVAAEERAASGQGGAKLVAKL